MTDDDRYALAQAVRAEVLDNQILPCVDEWDDAEAVFEAMKRRGWSFSSCVVFTHPDGTQGAHVSDDLPWAVFSAALDAMRKRP